MSVLFLVGWLLIFSAFSLIGICISHFLWKKIEAWDYLVVKLYGVSIFFGIMWLIGYSKFIPLVPLIYWLVMALGIIGAVFYIVKNKLKINYWMFAICELVFFLLIIGFLFIRGFGPTVTDGEKPMEMMILSSTMRATHLPPEDAWFAGKSLNYYYFGYFVFGSVGKMIGASSMLVANFGLATIWSMIFVGLASFGWSIAKKFRASFFIPVTFALFGNFDAVRQVFIDKFPKGEHFDWWRPSRMIPNAITEFPAFSYLFSDFHPHMIVGVWLTFLFVYLKKMFDAVKLNWLQGLMLGIIVGQIYIISTWSVLTAGLILMFCLIFIRPSWKVLMNFVIGFAIMALPYQMHTFSVWEGARLNDDHTAIVDFVMHWGIIFVGIFLFFLLKFKNKLLTIMFAAGAILVILAEITIIKDYIGLRMNTVFKFYWDTWLLWSAVAGIGFYALYEKGWWQKLILIPIVFVGLLYVFYGVPERYQNFKTWYGLDPQTFTFSKFPELKKPYEESKGKNMRIIERSGGSYSQDNFFSALTGIPTILGWDGHEYAWGRKVFEIDERKNDINMADVNRCIVPKAIVEKYSLTHCLTDDKNLVSIDNGSN